MVGAHVSFPSLAAVPPHCHPWPRTEREGIKILLSEKVEFLQKPKLSQLPEWIDIQKCLISTSLTPTIF